MADTRRILPFLWLHGEDEETLRRGVREIAESGCGSLCAESRVHPDYLGESWWREMAILTDECKKQGLTFWLLDDAHFPSGYANGAAKGTPLCRMMMTERHMDVVGPRRGGRILVCPDGEKAELVAVIAGRKTDHSGLIEGFVDMGGWAVSDLTDLTDEVEDGFVRWDVPEGHWRVFVLTASAVSERNPPQFFANPLLPGGGQLMIDTVYEAHWQHMKDDFGQTFQGFFSDEPALRAGRGCRAVLGEYPMLPIPWRMDMPDLLSEQLGVPARRLLPGLWYSIGAETPRIRYALMDTVSRLYAENYSLPIGDWCRAHGVQYIGHVIEQNNAHSRLGQGAGHFFRAMSGQDMAGMDLVLHELKPEFRHTSHAWKSQDFEADDDFFRYMLPQMTVSCARLDPKKKGRSLCEIFGAYGWQEDVAEMRYIANLLLSRGINHFTPHAFSLKPYPDPDSPPHFGAYNPLMSAISRLFGHMARVGSLLDGGEMVTRVGVLYYAEAEWAQGKSCMKTQEIVKALSLRQIACEIVPIDLLEPGRYDVLLIPEARMWPLKLFRRIDGLKKSGCRVAFINALPDGLSEGEGDIRELTAGMETLPLSVAAAYAAQHTALPIRVLSDSPDIAAYPYRKDGKLLLALFNEDEREAHSIAFQTDEWNSPVIYDSEEEHAWQMKAGKDYVVNVEPGQLLLIGDPRDEWPTAEKMRHWMPLADAWPLWNVSFPGQALRAFATDRPTDISRIDPRFSGVIRYETVAELPEGCAGVECEAISGSVEAWLDGAFLGHRDALPYRFSFGEAKSGEHALILTSVPPLVHRFRDPLSFYNYIKPIGLTGPVTWLKEDECHE